MSLDDVRQPQPIKFTLDGDTEDIDIWVSFIQRRAESMGYDFQLKHRNIFTIYPRAVND